MEFHTALKYIYKKYGTSVFDGRKSLNVLTDLQAFKFCPALKILYTKFLSIYGNDLITKIIDGSISKKDVTKSMKAFITYTGFRKDMSAYLFTSIFNIVNNAQPQESISFPNEYDPYYIPPAAPSKNSIKVNRAFLIVGVVCISLILFIIAFFNENRSKISESTSNEHSTEDAAIETTNVTSTEIEYQSNASLDTEDNIPTLESICDVASKTNSVKQVKNQPYMTNKRATIQVESKSTPVENNDETNEFMPPVDKSQYLSEARRYIKDPSTHYLADKYARLALQHGDLEARNIIAQLKRLGYYE